MFLAIDMKSFYASVECAERKIDPLKACLLVADQARGDRTICLAVSPALKNIKVPPRPRLFEAKNAIAAYEARSGRKLSYIVAPPRMKLYERISSEIYAVCLQFAAPEDIHVYSIDEIFIDCTPYSSFYGQEARSLQIPPSFLMTQKISDAICTRLKLPVSAGLGTNLYLAKIAMDLLGKHRKTSGFSLPCLTESSYPLLLWTHRPLTDFWMIGKGTARKLEQAGMYTMGDIAQRSQWDIEWFYRTFGIDAEILIDHAWGIEPVGIREIQAYRPHRNSLFVSQILPRPYTFRETRMILTEMLESLCMDLTKKHLGSSSFTWWASYADSHPSTLQQGRAPHISGSIHMECPEQVYSVLSKKLLASFDRYAGSDFFYRRLFLSAGSVKPFHACRQFSLFQNQTVLQKEEKLQSAILSIRRKYGDSAVFRGSSLLDSSTFFERNLQIGGHRA